MVTSRGVDTTLRERRYRGGHPTLHGEEIAASSGKTPEHPTRGSTVERTREDAVAGSSTTSSNGAGLMTPGEVARLFGVDPKTVSRWADAGKLPALRTLGGHRRYRQEHVRALLADGINEDYIAS